MIRVLRAQHTSIEQAEVRGQMSFAEAQDAVGGYIEVLRVSPTRVLLVNGDGRLVGLPHNEVASQIGAGTIYLGAADLRGDVVLVDGIDDVASVLGAESDDEGDVL